MLAIGTHVRIKDMNQKHIGTIILRSSSGWYTVEYRKPFRNTYYVRKEDLIVVSEAEWEMYNSHNIIAPNYVIENFGNENKSIEQEIMDMYYEGDVSAWMSPILWEDNEKIFKTHDDFWNLTEEDFKQHSDKTFLNAEEHEDLNKMYIELALLTGDEKWFNELTNKK